MSLSPSDPDVIIAGIKQFGLAPDGSDLRELTTAFERLRGALEKSEQWANRYTLPCDVTLPPRTIIRKGCSLQTLIVGLIAREKIGQ